METIVVDGDTGKQKRDEVVMCPVCQATSMGFCDYCYNCGKRL